MRTLLIGLLVLLTIGTLGLTSAQSGDNTMGDNTMNDTTVVYLVRHAEKLDGRDPSLSVEGAERAERLASMLRDEPITAVFVTETNRSRETAAPLATAKGIELSSYAPMDGDALARRIRSLPGSGGCLVVAHSNTVPIILRSLGGPARDELREADEYDLLCAIVLRDGEFVRALSLRY